MPTAIERKQSETRAHDDPPKRTPRDEPGPVPTLADLRQTHCWWWLYCAKIDCSHSAPMALVPLIIRWGGETTSEVRAVDLGTVQPPPVVRCSSASVGVSVVHELVRRLRQAIFSVSPTVANSGNDGSRNGRKRILRAVGTESAAADLTSARLLLLVPR